MEMNGFKVKEILSNQAIAKKFKVMVTLQIELLWKKEIFQIEIINVIKSISIKILT